MPASKMSKMRWNILKAVHENPKVPTGDLQQVMTRHGGKIKQCYLYSMALFE